MKTWFASKGKYLLLVAGVAAIVFGLWRGEAQTILNKAIRICLECIGIG